MPTLALANLHAADWAVLGAYALIIVGSGLWLGRRKISGGEDYFLGGRHVPAWAVGCSILATSLSAATFIGVPQSSYGGDLTYLSTNIGMILGIVVLAVWFIPAFYRHRVQTIYGLLEVRFGPGSRRAASGAFMVGRVMASGARIYLAAIPASWILFDDIQNAHLMLAIMMLALVAVIYTLAGGIASVIWADVIQTGVFLVAVTGAIIVLLMKIDAPFGDIVGALRAGGDDGHSKLTVLSLSTDFSSKTPYTLWTAVIAFTVMSIGSYGVDHDLAQRMLTCKSARAGGKAAIGAIIAAIPTVGLFLVVGLLLWVFYANPGGIARTGDLGYEIDDTRKIFLNFILHEMPPGLTGLMLAGLFAAGLSSLNSALNAMSSTLVSDFLKPLGFIRSAEHEVTVGRMGVCVWGVVLGAFACVCVVWQQVSDLPLLDFALSVMIFAYAGLVAVFLAAIFTKRGNTFTVISALIIGFEVIWLLRPIGWAGWTELTPWRWELSRVSLAWPWHLPIGVGIAFGVVMFGRRPGGTDRSTGDSSVG
jgi:SSS family transporter